MDGLDGSDAGFASWAAVRRTQLRRTAYLLCGDWAGADDLVQEALLRVYRHWRRLVDGNPDAYARRALTSVFIDSRRKPFRRRERLTARPPEGSYVDRAGERDDLGAALAQLPPRQRAAIVLRYWEDLSLEQTAEALGCSVGNVKSQSSRGLARLRTLLALDKAAAAHTPEKEIAP